MIKSWIEKSSLKQKVMAAFLIIGLLPTVLVSIVGLKVSEDILLEGLFSHLIDVKEVKKQQVEDYFNSKSHTLQGLANTLMVQEALLAFREGISSIKLKSGQQEAVKQDYLNGFARIYKEQNPESSLNLDRLLSKKDHIATSLQSIYLANSPYKTGERHLYNGPEASGYHQVHARYHSSFKVLLEELNLYDIFIVDNESSRIVYSVFKEVDFGTRLNNGPFADSGIAEAFRLAKKKGANNGSPYTVMTDYRLYQPSYDAPASFMASPIIINNRVEGYFIIQLPLDKLSKIMAVSEGLGKTGESYLVGEDHLLRTDTRRHVDFFNVKESFRKPDTHHVSIPSVEDALEGKTGARIGSNYQQEEVISAYSPLDIGGHRWAMVVEESLEEALKPERQLQLIFTLMLLGTIPLVILAAWWLTGNQLKPILAMTQLMDEVKSRWDFSLRSDNSHQDEIGQASQTFNGMVESLQQAISTINKSLGHFADGRFNVRIDSDMQGDLGTLKQAANATSVELEEVISGIINVMTSIQKGDFNQRIDRNTSGQLAELTEKINRTSEKLEFLTSSLLAMADAINNGELDYRLDLSREMTVQGAYEGLETKLNGGLGQLEEVVNTVQHVSSEVGSQIAEINAMSASMLHQSHEQASSSKTIIGNLHEWRDDVVQLVKDAKEGGGIVSGARNNAERVSHVIDGAEAAILDIREVSTRIGNVAKGITEVATQTTMLALNAAIEATKAGVEGKGFTVVADEVRVLADQSTKAAKEINKLVEETYSRVDKGVSSVGGCL